MSFVILKGFIQKGVLLICSIALFSIAFVPLANAKAAEKSYNTSNKQEQKELDLLTEILVQCLVKDENGEYQFDKDKAQKLGLSKKQIKEADNLFTNVLTQKDIKEMVGDNDIITTYSKTSITAKALIKVLKKYGKKVDSAIDKGIDLLPIKSSTKKAWKKTITKVALVKVLDNFVGISDTAENLVKRGIKTLIPGIPDWAASGIAKTLMMVLPI
ncbi:hypothetical protein [Heyndrickxia ginsengihumi]|uniref:hypothetical protein n=1 Tax=Heyndrickxia ginsengihumi TaxID=363870 RepID=UPI0004708E70|nr:hypothetical protein [Heyndrickxia ginsengihumi]